MPEDEIDADKPAVASDRLRIAKWAVWLFTAGAIGVAAYFFAKSDLASNYWRGGKDYVSTQLEVIKKDGFEHWARSTKPEVLKREGSSDEGDKPAKLPDIAKTEAPAGQAGESESNPTDVAKAAAPAMAPQGEKSKPPAKAPPAAVAEIESASKREAAPVLHEVSKIPEVSKKLAEDKAPAKVVAPEAIEPATSPAPVLRGQPSAAVLALSDEERSRLTKTISEIIAEWSFSWATQDFARYSSFYSRDFSSDRYATLSAWLKFRRSRIVGRQDIDVDVHDLKLIAASNQAMTFDFVQRWSSGNRQIYSVKRMTMTQETPGWWSISRELATDLPANHPVVLEALRSPAIERKPVSEAPVKKFSTSSLGQEKQDQAITEMVAVESPQILNLEAAPNTAPEASPIAAPSVPAIENRLGLYPQASNDSDLKKKEAQVNQSAEVGVTTTSSSQDSELAMTTPESVAESIEIPEGLESENSAVESNTVPARLPPSEPGPSQEGINTRRTAPIKPPFLASDSVSTPPQQDSPPERQTAAVSTEIALPVPIEPALPSSGELNNPPPEQTPSDDPPVAMSVQEPALEVSEIPADLILENSAVASGTPPARLPEIAPPAERSAVVADNELKLPVPNEPTLLVTELVLMGSIRAFSKAEVFGWMGSVVGRNVTFPDLEKSVAAITRNYRDRGYVAATALIPQQSFADGRVEIMVYEGDLDPDRPVRFESKEGLRLDTEWASRIVKNAIGNEPIQQETLERGLLMLQEIPGVSATVDLEPGLTQGTVRAAVVASEGKPVEGSLGGNNMGAKSTGRNVGAAEVRFNNPLGQGEQLGLTYKPSEKQGQESYSLIGSIPVGDYGWRVGLSANHVTYRVDSDADTQARGKSDDITVSFRYPIQRSRGLNQSFAVDLTAKKMSDYVNNESIAEKSMTSIGASYNFDKTDLSTGNTFFGSVGLTSGNLDLTKNPEFFEADQDGPKTHGGFLKTLISGGASIRLPANVTFGLTGSTQTASKNLNTSEKFGLGGPYGVRGYPVGEGSGDEGWRISAELKSNLFSSPFWGSIGPMVFYDTGSVTRYKRPDGILDEGQTNSYRLSGWGAGFFASKPNTYDFRLVWATKLGKNPGQRLDAEDRLVDNDGTNDKSRLWATFTYSF